MSKNYYELLELAPSAPVDEIKRAFRREIAKYHPDKVQHLGKEFQEIAAIRRRSSPRRTKSSATRRCAPTTTNNSLPAAWLRRMLPSHRRRQRRHRIPPRRVRRMNRGSPPTRYSRR